MIWAHFQLMLENIVANAWIDSFELDNEIEEKNNEINIKLDALVLVGTTKGGHIKSKN